ncbi:PDR/VanB family oxidoreductase [Acetobacter conturbans]|uniref:2Fe-2S iron-sulfur cluster binding domain-containing protein n=1 Tax=Acetobacter conturbans TaxID=1737472 RepID=A0ABX0K2F5_9PROT|nr:PDR/VanB family oxidoreductase [Acetobacter conturbans]NHN88855.1 2Fe-2S iron-sulfur cluster binding domain-containing protein [Acetobacter conturbans]
MASSDSSLRLRLVEIAYGAPGINLYRFASLDGAVLPDFAPGAHVDLEITPDTVRQYSLLWPQPSPERYEIAVQDSPEGRGGSGIWHRETVVGGIYCLSVPRNHFPLDLAASAPYCLFAGGIGITPIISMYRQLVAKGLCVKLHYWTRGPEAALFREELAAARDGSVLLHDTSSVAPRLADILPGVSEGTLLYCCGPGRMIDAFDALTAERPLALVHRERFAAAPLDTTPTDGFSIRLMRSKRTLEVAPEETVLSVCLAAGIDLPYSCEEGVCGACEVRVLSGQIDHRDQVLSATARATADTMMACCSRGLTTLELDL